MFQNYLKIALRNLTRNKVFSVIHVAGLSLGLACCMLIFLYIKDELSFDRFHDKTNQLYQLETKIVAKDGKQTTFASSGMVQGPTFKQEIPEIEAFVRVKDAKFIVKKGKDTFYEQASWVDQNFFSVFSFPLISGDPKKVLADIHSVVLTEEIAQKYFGTSNAIGKTLDISVNDVFEPFVVTGIAKKSPQNSSIKFKMLLSFNYQVAKRNDDHWLWSSYPTYFVIRPDANVKKMEAKMAQIYQNKASKDLVEVKKMGFDIKLIYGFEALALTHLNTNLSGLKEASDPIYSYILTGIALFILLIACINFINLTVAQSLRRGKEIGIRKVSGSNRNQLMMQFMSESFLLCLLAFLFSFFIVEISLPYFNELANKQLALSYLFDYQLVIGLFILFIATAVLSGLYPALVLSGFDPIKTLYNRMAFSGKNYLSKSLMVLQFSLATFMLIVTFFVYNQFEFLTHKSLGYDDHNLIRLDVGQGDNKKLMQVFKNEFMRIPGVINVAPRQSGTWSTLSVSNKKELDVDYNHIDESYLPTLGLKLVSGRNFSAAFPADSTTGVMVNEAYMREAGWKPTDTDKTIDFLNGRSENLKIVGVVKDYHFTSLKQKIKPQVFTIEPSMEFGDFYIKINEQNKPKTLLAIEGVSRKISPYRPFVYDFVDDFNFKLYESEQKWKQIIGLGALLMIFISCIGLFGLITLSIQQRTKEIGIRKVLGASVLQISSLVSSSYISLVFVAFLVAIPSAWFATNKWLEGFAYKIQMSWQTFALAACITILIA